MTWAVHTRSPLSCAIHSSLSCGSSLFESTSKMAPKLFLCPAVGAARASCSLKDRGWLETPQQGWAPQVAPLGPGGAEPGCYGPLVPQTQHLLLHAQQSLCSVGLVKALVCGCQELSPSFCPGVRSSPHDRAWAVTCFSLLSAQRVPTFTAAGHVTGCVVCAPAALNSQSECKLRAAFLCRVLGSWEVNPEGSCSCLWTRWFHLECLVCVLLVQYTEYRPATQDQGWS